MNDKVSIIIPVYNGNQHFIESAIDSVCKQTYLNIEIIIVDDGSTDSIAELLNEFQKKSKNIRVIHKNNEGVSIARNLGVEVSTGEFIFFMDADDYLEPNAIEVLMNMQLQYNSDMTACLYYTFNTNAKKSLYHGPDIQLYDSKNMDDFRIMMFTPTIQKQIYYPYCMCVWGKLIRKSAIINNNIQFNSNLIFSEDLLFLNKLSYCVNKIVITDAELYGYRISDESVTHKFSIDYPKNIMNMLDVLKSEIDLSNEEINNAYVIYKVLFLINITKFYIVNKENVLSYKNKIKELKQICQFFDLKESNYSKAPFKYKIFLYLLEYRCYNIAYVLAKIIAK